MMKKKADKCGCFTLPMRNRHDSAFILKLELFEMFYIAYEELKSKYKNYQKTVYFLK